MLYCSIKKISGIIIIIIKMLIYCSRSTYLLFSSHIMFTRHPTKYVDSSKKRKGLKKSGTKETLSCTVNFFNCIYLQNVHKPTSISTKAVRAVSEIVESLNDRKQTDYSYSKVRHPTSLYIFSMSKNNYCTIG